MTKRNSFSELGDLQRLFEYARRRDERPSHKPVRYAYVPARQPDMMLPKRPSSELRAAEAAISEIRDIASKARELYRGRRFVENSVQAKAFVRDQLRLGMLDVPAMRADLPMAAKAPPESPVSAEPPAEDRAHSGFWRRRNRRG